MPFLNGFLWTLVFSVGASHFPSPLVSSGLALELPGTAGLLSSPYTHHLSSQWASRGSAPEDLKGLMWLANQEFRASSRDLQPLLPAGLLGLSIQQLTHLLWFPLVSSLQDLLFAVKWLQRLPFLICIVWMHLFLFIFSLVQLQKGVWWEKCGCIWELWYWLLQRDSSFAFWKPVEAEIIVLVRKLWPRCCTSLRLLAHLLSMYLMIFC